MAELYGIRCFYNTGFDAVNRPAAPEVLVDAQFQDYQSNYLRQDGDRATTRIRATYDDMLNVDYVQIGRFYYIVTAVTMQSNLTAELSLLLDPMASSGGTGAIQVIGGWLERGHVSSANDGLFENCLQEPWSPSAPLVLDPIQRIGAAALAMNDDDTANIVESTVDLLSTDRVAEVYETEAESLIGGVVTIPKIPETSDRCTFGMWVGGNVENFVFPYASFYNANNDIVKSGINSVRSLGIEGAVVDSYQIPIDLLYQTPPAGIIRALAGKQINAEASAHPYRYGLSIVNNNKVYAMYNTYVIASSCSGDRREFKAEDLYNNDDYPVFMEYVDPSPNGKPYIQPTYYHKARTVPFQECIEGATWYRLPISLSGRSGSLIASTSRNRELEQQTSDIIFGAIGQANNIRKTVEGMRKKSPTSSFADLAYSGIEAAHFALDAYYDLREGAIDYQTSQNIVAPEIVFPQSYGAQSYLGNTFYIYRTRLSENDIVRCDNFFTQYGYAQDKKFESSDMSNRSQFNYVKTRGANIKCNLPLRMRNMLNALLDGGVRLWHVLPNASALVYNP